MQKNVNSKVKVLEKKGPYVEGQYENLGFSSKVYDNPSPYGINEGRISKLLVFNNPLQLQMLAIEQEAIVANYDRGWDIQSDDPRISTIIEYLEKLS